MTKEETLDMIIDDYKDGNQSAMSDYCDRIKCYECPFESGDCVDEVNNMLIDRLIKAEEKKETNLEHYWKGLSIGFLSHNNEAYESYRKQSMALFDWLFAPYEETKPKYKLSKFEYDLLDYCCYKGCDDTFKDWTVLMDMQNNGHYKGISKEIKMREI